MAGIRYSTPNFTRSDVNWAGKVLCDDESNFSDDIRASVIIDDWRSAHRRPVTHVNVFLRQNAKAISPRFVVAQRLKRTPSIRHKLRIYSTMKLSQMQDIGGCRIVLRNIRDVRRMEKRLRSSRTKMRISHSKDYISDPKESGYRGVHLIYKYHSNTHKDLSGLMVEVQLRTEIQHVWATGVETVGTFLRSPLKSSIGPESWLRFFARFSKVLHFKEMEPRHYHRNKHFVREVLELGVYSRAIDAERRLTEFGRVIGHIEAKGESGRRGNSTFVLYLKPNEGLTDIWEFFGSASHAGALNYYSQLEREADPKKGEDVVLVATDSIKALKSAYPNYFMDTRRLVEELKKLERYMV